jgi:hypothetical protein
MGKGRRGGGQFGAVGKKRRIIRSRANFVKDRFEGKLGK